jgi:hypothetical protein
MRLVTIALVAIVCAGCGSAPQKHDFDKSRTVTQGYDQTWEDIVSFFASRNIQVKNIAKDSGVIYAETSEVDPTDADCGKPPMLWVAISNQGRFNVFVRKGDQKQVVSVNAQFIQVQQTAMTNPPTTKTVSCTSTGLLEREILTSLTTQ